MKIDLRKDYLIVKDYVENKIQSYNPAKNAGPGDKKSSISLITLGFSFDQSGWVALVFDTRAGAESDGFWQDFIEENELSFEHWFDSLDPLAEATADDEKGEPVSIILHDGKEVTLEYYDEEEVADYIGSMLWEVMVECRERSLLGKLPLSKKCLMAVSDHDGFFGWPVYGQRFELGLVN